MKFKNFIQSLDENNYYFYEWVQDFNDENIYYMWRTVDKGYKINKETMVIESINDCSNYSYHPFDNKIIEQELGKILNKRIQELNKSDNFNLFERWLVDKQDESKYYYWKGENKGYMAIIENDGIKLPQVVEVKTLDKDYFEPRIMQEFKNYKVKRLLEKKLKEIKEENSAKKNIFGTWTEDNNIFYYWKNENEGYMALIENENFPEIKKFELVNNEYFEPRNLQPVINHKIKKVLEKKIK